jgi:hypothetical protein
MALRPGSSGGPLVDRLGRAVAVVTAGTRDASGVTFAIRIDAALAAFPQLEPWASSAAPRVPHPAARSAADERRVRAVGTARAETDPRAAEVAQLAGGVARPSRPVEVEPKAAAMVTVWEASRAVRRVSARPTPRLATVPCHDGRQLLAPPFAPPAVLLSAASVAVGTGAGRIEAGPCAPR